MGDLAVRVVRLDPMRVACARVISATPEKDAWEKLSSWAESKRLLDNPKLHPVFGFNNPSPSPGRPEYGYEFWIRVDPGVAGEGGIEVKDFPGGLYAVTTCRLVEDPAGSVLQVWKGLWDWAQSDKKYRWRKTHELEQCRNPQSAEKEMVLDLYLPIEERAAATHDTSTG